MIIKRQQQCSLAEIARLGKTFTVAKDVKVADLGFGSDEQVLIFHNLPQKGTGKMRHHRLIGFTCTPMLMHFTFTFTSSLKEKKREELFKQN